MNREFLEGLDLEKEAIDKAMAEYGKSVNSYKEKIEELEGLSGKVSDYEKKIEELNQSLNSKEEKFSSYESNLTELQKEVESYKLKDIKTNIAVQAGIPLELASRLSGETEEEIKADAETMAGFVNKKQPLPLKHTEPPADDKDAGLKQMLGNLTKQY